MLKPAGHTVRWPEDGEGPGEHGSIAFTDKDWNLFIRKANPKGRAQIEVAMRAWCSSGPTDIPDKKFGFELRYSKGGKSVRVDAFKGHQVRFYGATAEVDGKPMFLVTRIDLAKKQTDADRSLMEAAGEAAFELIHTSKDMRKK